MSDCKWSWDFQRTHAWIHKHHKAKMVKLHGSLFRQSLREILAESGKSSWIWLDLLQWKVAMEASWILQDLLTVKPMTNHATYATSKLWTSLHFGIIGSCNMTPTDGYWMLLGSPLAIQSFWKRLQHVVNDQQESHHLRNFKPRPDIIRKNWVGNGRVSRQHMTIHNNLANELSKLNLNMSKTNVDVITF
jgi:hypothetical protein